MYRDLDLYLTDNRYVIWILQFWLYLPLQSSAPGIAQQWTSSCILDNRPLIAAILGAEIGIER